uniref:Grass carp reovirus (GCRV)-induced gene 2l n=1 Tax=Sinocyclocheilus grahami TaxID=75366 RepID=A0A672LSS5_SINGR
MEHLSSWTHPERCAIYTCFQQEAISFRSNIRGANMWAEDDLGGGAPACLESYIEPVECKVYRMYHGTSRENAEKIKVSGFKQSSAGMLGPGVYLSRDLQKASRYPLDLPENQRVIVRVKVNVGRVKKIDCQRHPLQKTWHDHGYDTAWCPPNCGMVPSGLEEDCVWDPRRITVIDLISPMQEEQSSCRIL